MHTGFAYAFDSDKKRVYEVCKKQFGDFHIVNMVMEEVAAMGIRDITICASSLGVA